MAKIKEFSLVYISPSPSDWTEKVKENFGPLSGYAVDLNNGKTIDTILLDLLKLQPEGAISYPNYWNIKDVYLEYVKSLQENLEQEDNTIKQEISTLEATSPSQKTVDILKKYGILTGIELFIPHEKVYRNYDDFMGENVYKGGRNPYEDYWDEVISARDYVPEKGFRYYDVKLAVQVLIYSKVKFKLIDITNFISNVTTNNNIGSGGNFTIQMNLASQAEINAEQNFQDNNINITGYTKALFLQSIFRENDLVFIRFEKLKAETDTEEGEYDDSIPYAQAKRERRYKKSDKKIKGRYWDMIGLVDNTSINSTYNNIGITIVGRDLVKLLIEDYNFFIPIQFGNTPETIFGGGGTKVFQRLFTSGEYNLEFTKAYRSIEASIGFILSQLTNTQILSPACLEFLKKEYGDDLSKQFTYNPGGGKEEKEKVINGIWGLVNYYVDEKIQKYRLADTSLRDPNGSVMQQIHKTCQEPFVEVIADTFVDKYSLILRRPPFTMDDISKQKFIVIGRESTISEDLIFNQEVYTIFQLNPQGGCFVNNNSIPLAYLPMVVLDEYTKMWGNKLYSQVFNYINIDAYAKVSEGSNKQNSLKETFVDALIWLIEANAYLPFSRTGTITIRGDRRIKIGQWIYFEKSNEIFYVDGVQHSVNISGGNVDRKTILKVSRGLVKDYVCPNRTITTTENIDADGKGKRTVTSSNVSYGDLVDIDYLREGLKELFIKLNKNFNVQKVKKDKDNESEFVKTNSIVVNEVFNFFLSGAQFEGEIMPYVKNYDIQPAITLNDISNLQRRSGGGGNGVNRTVSLTISDGSQSEGEQNNQTQQKQSQEIPASSKPKKVKRKKVQKGFRQVSSDVNVWVPIYE